MKALLIIDMQNRSFTPNTPRFDAEGVVKRINILSELFRKNGDMVIFIQHDGTKENNFLPGTFEFENLPSLIQKTDDIIVLKTANDAFYNTKLELLLKNLNIKEIVATGCATDFCVDSTVRSALSRDFNVTIIKDAHTTADRPHMKAELVIEHHNYIWSDMIPTRGKMEVMTLEQYLISAQQ